MAAPDLDAVRLYRMDLPDHACPWGLRAMRLLQDHHIPFEDHPLRSEAEVAAFKAAQGVVTTPQIFAGSERIGGYTDLAARLGVRPESSDISYTPVVVVFATAALMAFVLGAGFRGFMGIAIGLLAMLKLMDVEAFAASFRKYDLLTQRWGAWGRLYPGVELLVGLGVLWQPRPVRCPGWWGRWPSGWGPWAWCRWGRRCSSTVWPSTVPVWEGTPKHLWVVSFAENLIMALMGVMMLA